MAASEDADEADEITIEEIVIVSIIETVLEEADNVIEIEETSVELAVLEAAERVDEEADENIVEEIVINSIIEAIIDKIAGDEAIHDNTAGERVEEFTVESSVGRGTSRRRV